MNKIKKEKKRISGALITVLAVIMLVAGGYALITALYPHISSYFINESDNSTIQKLEETKEEIGENRLYIPKVDINLPYSTGDESVMETGAWWRAPGSGNPKDGGNFVLSAHRFVMGVTPGETIKQSPFYNINKLNKGDTITIDYEGERYEYTIEAKFDVPPTAVEIEAPTDDDRLTLYSCGLGGSSDKREVLIAKLTP